MKRNDMELVQCKDHQPSGYLDWHAWAEKMARTHTQTRCQACGLWDKWVKKKRSEESNEPK